MQLTVNNNTYDYPDAGSPPGWGGEATAWAAAVTDVLSLLLAPGDILRTSFSLQNNTAVATAVQGLIFDSAIVRAANVTYSVTRNDVVEYGTMFLSYNAAANPGEKWALNVQSTNPVGVSFDVQDNGQVLYTTTDDTEGGTMIFSARTLSA